MSIYIAMINDRHSDPEPYLFATAAEAIDYARAWAHECASVPVDEDHIDGWLYHASYDTEGSSVWVIEKEHPAIAMSNDTLPQWLYRRWYGERWYDLSEADQAYWRHEAAAVRRAVERGGFKEQLP